MKTSAPVPLSGMLFVLLTSAAVAQPAPDLHGLTRPADRQAQRLRITQERERQDALYGAAERMCYQRFAVNDCLHAARLQRRAALDELRRQEVILNDLDRQAQAQAAIERIGQKVESGSLPQ